ncbi:MAG: GAF domain-containing protein [Anaerolineae bacterium]|nr:GAF domain-containing protein [Anaerolineae bacterium]
MLVNESARELESLRQEADRLLDLSGCFTFLMDEEQILIAALREISDTEVDRCVIALFEDIEERDPAWLQVVALYDRENGELGLPSVFSQFAIAEMPVVERLLRDKEPIVVLNCDCGSEIAPLCRDRLWLQEMSAVAVIPLIVMGWPIGMLVMGKRTREPFAEFDLRFYQILANLAAMPLRAVHLIEAQRRRLAEQNAVNSVGKAVSSIIHLNDLLEMVYEQINTVMHAENFYIALHDPFHDEVSFPFAIENARRVQWADRQAGRGLTEYVLRTHQPLLLPGDVPDRLRELGIAAIGQMACAWIGAPLIVGEKVIGIMAAQDFASENVYTPADLDLLAALANQVAVAIENARLYEETQRQALYLRLAAEVGRRIILILDIDELLRQVVELIRDSFGYYHVQAALVDEKTQEVVAQAGSSVPGLETESAFPRVGVGKEGLIGWVAGRGEPLLVNDVTRDSRYLHIDALPDTRSELVVPIKFGSRVIGVLDVESDRPNAFHPEDIPIMYTLADQVAIAIANARLFEEKEQRIRELNVLVNIGQSLCNVTYTAQLLELVRTQVGTLLDVSNIFVALYNPQEATIYFPLAYDDGARLEPFTLHYDAKEGLTSWVIENQRALLIRDWAQVSPELVARVVERGTMDTRAWLAVPILRCDQVLGAIGVQSAEPDAFDERHQTVLTVVAAQLALALGALPE